LEKSNTVDVSSGDNLNKVVQMSTYQDNNQGVGCENDIYSRRFSSKELKVRKFSGVLNRPPLVLE
jgi:hypothetical protein